MIYDWDLATNALWWSESFAERFGLQREDIAPGIESWLDRIHPDERPTIDESVHRLIASTGEYWTVEIGFAAVTAATRPSSIAAT